MFNKLGKPFRTTKSDSKQTQPKCPDCHNNLQLPPSLESLQKSEKARYIKFDNTIDRTVPACKICAYKAAKEAGTIIPSPQDIQAARRVVNDKLEKARDLLASPDLDEETKTQLRMAMPVWNSEIDKMVDEEKKLKDFLQLKNVITQTVDLIGQGIYVDQLKPVLEENVRQRDAFEDELERKGWMPYWAVWGYDGEMKLT